LITDTYFRRMISDAYFKMSFSILSRWISFRNAISLFSSGERLSFSEKEPVCWACLIQRSNADALSSYSLTMFALLLISHSRIAEPSVS